MTEYVKPFRSSELKPIKEIVQPYKDIIIRHAIMMLHAIGMTGAEAEECWKEMK